SPRSTTTRSSAMSASTSESTSVRLRDLERREDERRIFAESALHGERAVAWLRIVTWFLLGIAFSAMEAVQDREHLEAPHRDPFHVHEAMIAFWIIFAVVVVVVLRRMKTF